MAVRGRTSAGADGPAESALLSAKKSSQRERPPGKLRLTVSAGLTLRAGVHFTVKEIGSILEHLNARWSAR